MFNSKVNCEAITTYIASFSDDIYDMQELFAKYAKRSGIKTCLAGIAIIHQNLDPVIFFRENRNEIFTVFESMATTEGYDSVSEFCQQLLSEPLDLPLELRSEEVESLVMRLFFEQRDFGADDSEFAHICYYLLDALKSHIKRTIECFIAYKDPDDEVLKLISDFWSIANDYAKHLDIGTQKSDDSCADIKGIDNFIMLGRIADTLGVSLFLDIYNNVEPIKPSAYKKTPDLQGFAKDDMAHPYNLSWISSDADLGAEMGKLTFNNLDKTRSFIKHYFQGSVVLACKSIKKGVSEADIGDMFWGKLNRRNHSDLAFVSAVLYTSALIVDIRAKLATE